GQNPGGKCPSQRRRRARSCPFRHRLVARLVPLVSSLVPRLWTEPDRSRPTRTTRGRRSAFEPAPKRASARTFAAGALFRPNREDGTGAGRGGRRPRATTRRNPTTCRFFLTASLGHPYKGMGVVRPDGQPQHVLGGASPCQVAQSRAR